MSATGAFSDVANPSGGTVAIRCLSDTEISAITGKTPETVRHYAKQARKLMVAFGAAEKIAAANVSKIDAK